jgi:hypothetical protein
VTPWHGRRFAPRTGSLLLARGMTIGDAHLAPGNGGSVAARGRRFRTVTGSHYVDIYDGAKSKGAWTVRDTVSVCV